MPAAWSFISAAATSDTSSANVVAFRYDVTMDMRAWPWGPGATRCRLFFGGGGAIGDRIRVGARGPEPIEKHPIPGQNRKELGLRRSSWYPAGGQKKSSSNRGPQSLAKATSL